MSEEGIWMDFDMCVPVNSGTLQLSSAPLSLLPFAQTPELLPTTKDELLFPRIS